MQFREWLILNEVKEIGYQEVEAKKLSGPFYHGTTIEKFKNILKTGFSIPIGGARSDAVRHGYPIFDYANGIPAPVHHLGFGSYFTKSESIAKEYQGTTGTTGAEDDAEKQLDPLSRKFYLDVPRLEVINFTSPNTMMKWWRSNGYDMPPLPKLQNKSLNEIEQIRIQSTMNMTENLKQKYDAVWFKGKKWKGRPALDRDQTCVYDPNRIYMLNLSLNLENEFFPEYRVKIKGIPVAVQITHKKEKPRSADPFDVLFNQTSRYYFKVKLSSKDLNKIKEFYYQQIYDILLNHPDFEDLLQTRMKNMGNSREESARIWADWKLSKINLLPNFPESLLERKLEKGERVK